VPDLPPDARFAKRKALAAAAGAALLLATAVAVLAPMLARADARLIEEMREKSETALDAALALRRAGDLPGMRQYAERVRAACDQVAAKAPRRPEPHHLLGRMHRALMRFDEAMAAQDRALALRPDFAPARGERGFLHARLHEERVRAIIELHRRRGAEGGADGWRPLAEADGEARRLRDAARADLAGLPDPFARGVLAWLAGDRPRARALIEAATKEPPQPQEAWELLGRFALQEGDGAAALQWLDAGVGRDRGHLPTLLARADVRVLEGGTLNTIGRDPGPAFAAAIDDLDAAARLDPRTDVRDRRARARIYLAGWRIERGENAEDLLKAALADCDAPLIRGMARFNLAHGRHLRGEEAVPLYRQSIRDFDEALRLRPNDDDALDARGGAWGALAQAGAGSDDPDEPLRRAVADFDRAIEIEPQVAVYRFRRGMTHFHWAAQARARSDDVVPHLTRAAEDQAEAARLDPRAPRFWAALSSTRICWGTHLAGLGRDPSEPCRQAIADAGRALALEPSNAVAINARAFAHLTRARWSRSQGHAARDDFEAALRDFTELVRLSPRMAPQLRSTLDECREALQ